MTHVMEPKHDLNMSRSTGHYTAERLRALEDNHLLMLAVLRDKLPSTFHALIKAGETIRKQAGLS